MFLYNLGLFDDWQFNDLKGMKHILSVLLITSTSWCCAQTTAAIETSKFYEALNKGDSAVVMDYLADDAKIKHLARDTTFEFSKNEFSDVCDKFKSGLYHEIFVIKYPDRIDELGYTQVIEVEYQFLVNGKKHHCGKDVFVWIFNENKMKIDRIYSTDYSCELEQENDSLYFNSTAEMLGKSIDKWHDDAAHARINEYFGFMAEDFYFLGTDPTERWSKKEFLDFCAPHFKGESAWDFKVLDRNIYFSEDGDLAWFDEHLDTWMEDCRGSGVLEKVNDTDWKLKHYNLTVLIENEKVKAFIKLRKN